MPSEEIEEYWESSRRTSTLSTSTQEGCGNHAYHSTNLGFQPIPIDEGSRYSLQSMTYWSSTFVPYVQVLGITEGMQLQADLIHLAEVNRLQARLLENATQRLTHIEEFLRGRR